MVAKPRKILIVNTSNANTSSGYLFAALAKGLRHHADAQVAISHLNASGRGRLRKIAVLLPSWRRLRAVWQADTVITHTSVVFSMQEILLSRLLGKRILAIYWDAYPDSFVPFGQKMKATLVPYGWLERSLLRLADKIMPPSDDYLPYFERNGLDRRARTFAMWPFTPIVPVPVSDRAAASERPLEIGFAGAVNPIRGFDDALRRIAAANTGAVVIHTYGHDAPEVPSDLADAVNAGRLAIRHHGFVDQNEIMGQLASHDLGLVSLSSQYLQPSFPSKTVSYICAGLPILYTGPALPALHAFLKRTGMGVVLDESLTDLHAEARRLRVDLIAAQARAVAELTLDGERIADFLK